MSHRPLRHAATLSVLLLLAACGGPPPYSGGDVAADDTVFRCTTANGKVVQVVQTATHVRYTFGKPGQAPEMTIETPTAELDYSVSTGSQIESFLMNFKNGDTTYLLDASTFHEDPDWNGQLTVFQGDAQLAMLDCRNGTVEFTAGNMAKEP